MTAMSSHAPTGPTATKKARSGISISAAGIALGLALSSCGFFEESSAVTYEVQIVSGDAGAENLRVEYLGRESGLSGQETVGSTVTDVSNPAQFETLGRIGDDLSVSVAGISDAVLQCAVIVDGTEPLVEEESSGPGEGVECSATVPAQDDQ